MTTEVHQQAREEVILRQQQEMMELSTPVVKLWEGILALPMIGTLDSSRTQVVMEALLQRIVETGSSMAIIDITGVPLVDTLVAQHLLKTVTAARLMGADCIISGIRPQIAQTIVHLGVDLTGVTTKATLADALALALQRSQPEGRQDRPPSGPEPSPRSPIPRIRRPLMERIPILRMGDFLLVTVQVDMHDRLVMTLQEDLTARIVETGAKGVLIDISGLEMVDSFIGRMLGQIAAMSAILDAITVVVGMSPAVAITLVELGMALPGVRTCLNVEKGMEVLRASLGARRRRRTAMASTISGSETMAIASDSDVVLVRQAARARAIELGFGLVDQTKMITAASEIARNTLVYGGGGTVRIECLVDGVRKGLRMAFEDHGPGIADIELALKDGYTTGNGMGLGLSGTRRLVNEFELDSRVGRGDPRHDHQMEVRPTDAGHRRGAGRRAEPGRRGEADRLGPGRSRRASTRSACGKVALAASELAGNLARHAKGGELIISAIARGSVAGVEFLAIDRGPGMADFRRCLADGYSTAGTPGTGLGAVARLADEFDAQTAVGQGTVLVARIWAAPAEPPSPRQGPGPGGRLGLPAGGRGAGMRRRLGDRSGPRRRGPW